MTSALLFGGLGLGLLVTFLTSVFKSWNLSTKAKHSIAVLLSVGLSFFITWRQFNGDYSFDNLSQVFAAIYASSQLFYNYLLKGTNLDQVLTNFSLFGGNNGPLAQVVEQAVQPALADQPVDSTTSASVTPGA